MIRIGLKSLVLGLVVAGLIAFAGVQHLFDIRRVLSLQPEVLWLIGCLASFISLGLAFFLRSGRESPYHLAIGRHEYRRPGSLPLLTVKGYGIWMGVQDEESASEFGRVSFALISGLGLLVFGLIILQNRSLVLLQHFYHNMTKDYGHICRKEGEEIVVAKPPKMGCELVKKAFALGYTKDLGDCADDPADQDEEICTHRQWDEPAAHYSYRLVERFIKTLLTGSSPLKVDTEKLPELVESHVQGFLGVPRSVIHIFTDLPEPGSWLTKARRRLHPNHCQDELRELRFRMTEQGAEPGAQLEDTLNHLLFSPAVGRNADYCRPYIIHWGAAANTCSELMSKGEAALDTYDVRQSIDAVMKRPKPLVSFHCLVAAGSAPAHGTLSYAGQTFKVDAVTLPTAGPDGIFPSNELFAAVAQVFVPEFAYNNLDRNRPLNLSEDRFQSEIARSGDNLMLAKFELLRSSDVLAGDQWVYRYPQYMDVYPWQPHIANFVSRFRKAYRQNEEKP
ncbi:MAG TPA: hypothetical protein VE954_24595 [Oligoflexus sp.]|uniref:hypothetical protein n=1 Tax=Oligoflexus sp. TaxID=1971216 RepID=UPI002D2D24EC|nr:hypothetical protein [Oligoflexus sp.]HYX36296.1 hypothetical protein [Oligoflexus sp.]